MEITIEMIWQKFREYNRLYFTERKIVRMIEQNYVDLIMSENEFGVTIIFRTFAC